MYSGRFGRAHSFEDILALARLVRPDGIEVALGVRGNRERELRSAIGPADNNIHILPFASADQLEQRLASADIHGVSLRDEWTGTVVPSKFFGALAIGRPSLSAGAGTRKLRNGSMLTGWVGYSHPERLPSLQ
jgi:hypothetical protein